MNQNFEEPGQVERDWSDAISKIEEIIEDARNGRMFVLVDHEDRKTKAIWLFLRKWRHPTRSTSWQSTAAV